MRSKETRVGARGLLKIEADPQATPEEIRRLPKKKALAHVNCPPELWWELAALHPMEAQASTLYELITLMEPGKWDELEKANAEKWIDRFMGHLPVPSQHLFSADCAEHVLPFFENVFPDDDRPREAIRMRRVLAQGLTNTAEGSWVAASKAAAKAGRHAARMAEDSAPTSQAVREARWTARGAANAAAGPAVGSSVAYAPAAAALVFGKGGSAIPERMWQWRRLQAYLRGEVGSNVGGKHAAITKEILEEALRRAGGNQSRAAADLKVSRSQIYTAVQKFGLDVKRSPEAMAEINRSISESRRQRWANLSDDDRAAQAEAMRQGWADKPTEENRARAEAIRRHWANMPKEELAAYGEKARQRRANMSDEERAAHAEAVRQGWDDMSDEDRADFAAMKQEHFAAKSPEVQRRMIAAMTAKTKGKKGKVGAIAKLPSDIILQYWSYLDDQGKRLYLALCLETVLPIFEKEFPEDTRPRRAMEAAKAYAYGKISKRAMYNKARVANVDYAGITGGAMTTQRARYAGEASNYLGREWLPSDAATLSWNAVPESQKRALQEKQLAILRQVLQARAADINLHAKNEEYFPLPSLQSKTDPFLIILATNLRQAVVQMVEHLQAEMRTPKFPKRDLDALYEIIGQIQNEIQETTNAKDWVYAADNYDLLFQESEPPTALELAIYVTLGKDPSKVAKTLLRLSQERNRAL